MADLLHDIPTPCPSRPRTSKLNESRELRTPVLAGAKPRRRGKGAPSFHIHEDGDDGKNDCNNVHNEDTKPAVTVQNRRSLLAQPAQRFRPKVNFSHKTPSEHPQPQPKPENNLTKGNASVEGDKTSMKQDETVFEKPPRDIYKKAVRRNTVYIPQDDTTVASVFMGLFSPLKSQDATSCLNSEDTQINSLEERIARKRLAKKSAGASTRRSPLQSSASVPQDMANHVDVPGKGGGKENIPPGWFAGHDDKKCKATSPTFGAFSDKQDPARASPTSRRTIQPNKTNNATDIRQKAGTVRAPPAKRTALGDKEKRPTLSTRNVNGGSNNQRRNRATGEKLRSTAKLPAPSTLSKVNIPNLTRRSLNDKYPLLTENISSPSMYEDNWLAHQEIVITQLVNRLFDYAHPTASTRNPETLRHELLRIYQTSAFTHLHKRLHASLLHGNLNVSKDGIARNNCVKQDVGLRTRFIDTWLRVYNPYALRAAAETVIGRKISLRAESHVCKEKALKKELETFLDTFLLQNQDTDQSEAELNGMHADMASWEYARTVLRSVMMVVLLDEGRLGTSTMLPQLLFVTSSPYKSSAAVLQALGRLLLPSSGNIIKSLGQLDCHVYYEQNQLQEYRYPIDNLAVDLRDGVRLARIVEILLHPPTSCSNDDESHLDNSTTVTIPDGDTVFLTNNEGSWTLSQQLKFPCPRRAAKVFNVQTVLAALSSSNGSGIVGDIHAEDIVDGHREKTNALLWRLVSKWGLVGLVDWDELKKEISRLARKIALREGCDEIKYQDWIHGEGQFNEDNEGYAILLTRWASILAGLKGLRVDNLTTSFADGKVYGSIVDEYEGYIREDSGSQYGGRTLGSRLQALGCSAQFGWFEPSSL